MSKVLFSADLTDWTYDRLLRWRATETPDRAFLSFQGGVYETYGETWKRVCALARGLAAQGVKPGDRVATFAPNCRTAVHLWLALNLLGATDAPINPAFRGQPLAGVLNMLDVSMIVAECGLLPVLREIEDDLPPLGNVIHFSAAQGGADIVRFSCLTLAPLLSIDDALDGWGPPGALFNHISSILMTSGTSGPSKGVMVPHAQALLVAQHSVSGMRITQDDVFYCAHPIFHMSPRYCVFTAAMLTGARVWLDDSFQADRWLDRIREARATVTIAHGPLLEMIFAEPERADDADNPLKRLGTSPFPKHIAEAFERRFAMKGIETWGMTEVGIPCWHPYDEPLRRGSCGKIHDDWYEFRVVDPDTDIEVPHGVVGEFVIRPKYPSTLMQGYFGRPDATAEAWRNLWFHSGDGGYIDADGWVYFVDRLKDRIRRRAENISSFDIECAALKYPGVTEAAAVGVPSGFAGDDDVKLCIAIAAGSTVEARGLIDYLAKALPHHMVPRYIEILPALPRTPTTKIQKSALRASGVRAETWDRKAAGIELRTLMRS